MNPSLSPSPARAGCALASWTAARSRMAVIATHVLMPSRRPIEVPDMAHASMPAGSQDPSPHRLQWALLGRVTHAHSTPRALTHALPRTVHNWEGVNPDGYFLEKLEPIPSALPSFQKLFQVSATALSIP